VENLLDIRDCKICLTRYIPTTRGQMICSACLAVAHRKKEEDPDTKLRKECELVLQNRIEYYESITSSLMNRLEEINDMPIQQVIQLLSV